MYRHFTGPSPLLMAAMVAVDGLIDRAHLVQVSVLLGLSSVRANQDLQKGVCLFLGLCLVFSDLVNGTSETELQVADQGILCRTPGLIIN